MNFKEIRIVEGELSDRFEEIVQRGEVQFTTVPLSELDQWGQIIARTYLDGDGVNHTSWQLGDIAIRRIESDLPAYILKIDHPEIKYCDIHPQSRQFLWAKDEEHSTGVHPDEAFMWLKLRPLGFNNVSVLVHPKTGSQISIKLDNGSEVVMQDPQTGEDRKLR